MVWSCDACGREFAKRQAHFCVPAISVDAYYAGRPAVERAIFEAVREHLSSLGDDVIVEPVNIGILFKRQRTFAELRPKTRWIDLAFGLNRRLEHRRVTRTIPIKGGRAYHGVRLTSPEDVDATVLAWLMESYYEYGA